MRLHYKKIQRLLNFSILPIVIGVTTYLHFEYELKSSWFYINALIYIIWGIYFSLKSVYGFAQITNSGIKFTHKFWKTYQWKNLNSVHYKSGYYYLEWTKSTIEVNLKQLNQNSVEVLEEKLQSLDLVLNNKRVEPL
ncbi:MAG: hypothetical protein ACPHVL_02995 [Psychroflexus salarius]